MLYVHVYWKSNVCTLYHSFQYVSSCVILWNNLYHPIVVCPFVMNIFNDNLLLYVSTQIMCQHNKI